MAGYWVNEDKQVLTATGVVDAVEEWTENGSGGRQRTDRQAMDAETGKPLWRVEVLYPHTSYGRTSTVTAMVSVGADERPVVAALLPVRFEGLYVEVRLNKAKAMVEYWSATGLAGAVTSGRGSRSGGESA